MSRPQRHRGGPEQLAVAGPQGEVAVQADVPFTLPLRRNASSTS
jgi:hypothetical protein